jgi:hypothetical protein
MQNLFSVIKHIGLFLLCPIILLSCSSGTARTSANPDIIGSLTATSCAVSEQFFEYGNLRLYPVTLNQAEQTKGEFLSLAQGLQNKSIEITEKNSARNADGAEVNKLFIQNNSEDTLLLLGGEVIKGGKQDRTIAGDVIVPPNGKKYNVDVFCVEHGRWDYDNSKGDNAKVKFSAPAAMAKTSVRKEAVVSKDQSKVWDKVSEANTKAGNATITGTYNAFEENVDYQKEEKKYLAYFKDKIKAEKNVVGVLAATGDKVFAADIFANENLFKKRLDLLLPSYINEAIVDGGKLKISQKTVDEYASKLLKDEKSQMQFLKKNGKLFKVGDRKIHISSY